ncbi:glycoside hydrolase family 172 protein [Paenibacillus cymbidii]|uniref:glycoside hydrolase family 172 protein n=1 Tax=Paenibacillus cymbidii TaxID=1639034 RepID=UPI0010801F15|nr:glycoside hydrolase family 172 protein [Paenibacillus cymbidii]
MHSGMTALDRLAQLGTGVASRRLSSYDRTGGNRDYWPVRAGETVVLGEMQGAGIVKHIWMTTTEEQHNLRGLVLRMYWDGETTPSVLCPLGDFFGLGHGRANYWESLPLQASHLGMNSWFSMPYADGATITLTNEAERDSFIYFYIDYQETTRIADDLGRFHACWRRELVVAKDAETGPNAGGVVQRLNKTGEHNYVVLDARGKGHYVGCVLHLDTNRPKWWGEGDDMIFIDDEPWPPRLHGTGTEDYFCGAWNYNHLKRTHCTPYYGYSFKGNGDYTGKHSQYRFHIEDPVYFERALTFSIEHGHANDMRGDWSSSAYWYQIGRSQPLPDVGRFEDRVPFSHGGFENLDGLDRRPLSEP